uniref:sensor domain-containing diguanylate cyclase n=1 Tax=uncultured Streptococcus sp. TaxID=83427 RepID=UPI0025EA41A9
KRLHNFHGGFTHYRNYRAFHFRPRVGESPFNHISKENALKFKSNLNRAKRGEAFTTVSRISRGQKTPLYLEMIYSPIYDHSGKTIGVLCFILDVTWQKTREEKINEMISKDFLTKLYNRSYVESAFNECMFNKMETVTLILSDLNDFKHYNDTKGHIYGDNLLVRYTRILEDIMPDNAVVARLGGDEFVVLLPGVSRKQTEFLINVARLALFEDIGITASYGFHTDSYASQKSFVDFYMIADRRMYRNKKNKRSLVENE